VQLRVLGWGTAAPTAPLGYATAFSPEIAFDLTLGMVAKPVVSSLMPVPNTRVRMLVYKGNNRFTTVLQYEAHIMSSYNFDLD